MSERDEQKPTMEQDKYVPPPMDPYARYQTPYDRRPTDDKNPFIEFRRFADKQLSSLFDGWESFPSLPKMFGISDEMQKMREHTDKMRNDIQKHIEQVMEERQHIMDDWSTNDQVDKVREVMQKHLRELKEERQRMLEDLWSSRREESQRAAPVASSDEQDLPKGWLAATSRDGKTYYIEQASGKATLEPPTKSVLPITSELKTSEDNIDTTLQSEDKNPERADTIDDQAASWERGLRDCPGLKDYTNSAMHQEMDDEFYEHESNDRSAIGDRQAQWRRGFRNCPELKKHNDGTELAMYENLRAQQDNDYYHSDEHWEEVWQRGFENCPDLKTNGEEKRSLIEAALGRRDEHDAIVTLPASTKGKKGPWSWLPSVGFDGLQMQRASGCPALPESSQIERQAHIKNANSPDYDNERLTERKEPTLEDLDDVARLALKKAIDVLRDADMVSRLLQFTDAETLDDEPELSSHSLIDPTLLALFVRDGLAKHLMDIDEDVDEEHPVDRQAATSSERDSETIPRSIQASKQLQPEQIMPSIVSTMTTTETRTLPDGSVETKRVLKRRFANGKEEMEESHDISQPTKNAKNLESKKRLPHNFVAHGSDDLQQRKPGWFWN
ncbi:hypothetical protein LTS08_008390 [Lithohypha guttulata]|nr:hypothetical protein LTS08_008390 [Lithohypha guttulata]